MRLGILFSGGKDSCAALMYAKMHDHDVSCLLSIESKNPHSYLFHTPNIKKTSLQAEALGIPLLVQETRGEKEEELVDLVILLKTAKEQYYIEGIVTGAIHSVYQATRIQKVCSELGLWCFNPLWQRDSLEHVETLVAQGFEMYISAIAAYPLDQLWLGRRIDEKAVSDLKALFEKHKVNPAGEGGEYESFVAFAPLWKKEVVVTKASREYENHAGIWHIEEAKVEEKKQEEVLAIAHRALTHNKQLEQEKNTKKREETLLVSTCKEALSEMEFVEPIARILEYTCSVVHYTKLTKKQLESSKRVIICGTALHDDDFLSHLKLFSWLKTYDKPVFGICSGFQIMLLQDDTQTLHIAQQKQIGIEHIEKNPWGIKKAYFMHHNGLFDEKENAMKPFLYDEKKKRYAVLFHPEVRNEDIIKDFLSK